LVVTLWKGAIGRALGSTDLMADRDRESLLSEVRRARTSFLRRSGLAVTTRGAEARLALLIATAAATAVLASASGPAGAAFGGVNGTIAFMTERDGDEDIYVMNPDGTGQRPLTVNDAFDGWPAWSADGKEITFTSARDGDFEIYTMDADGSNQMNRTNFHASGDVDSGWSPDGQKIVFHSGRDGLSEVYAMNRDGGNQKRLTDPPEANGVATFSPDGTKIAFTSTRDGNPEIYVMNADGTNQLNLTNSLGGQDWEANWSPDGRRIAFTSNRDGDWEIYVMNSDGSGQTRITNRPGIDWEPEWSPDGTKIAFGSGPASECLPPPEDCEIWVMNSDGTNAQQVTDNEAPDNEPHWQPLPARCAKEGTTLTVAIGPRRAVTIGRNGSSFHVTGPGIDDPTCGGATVNNVDTVRVTGSVSDDSLTLDLTNGQFAPGIEHEEDGKSEIELDVDLGSSSDALTVQGGSATEKIALGADGVNLNGDNDADVTIVAIESATVSGGNGNDLVDAAGGADVGAAFPLPLTLDGGEGNDVLTGGAAADSEIGGPGNDTFKETSAVGGGDSFTGGDGTDTLSYAARRTSVVVTLDGEPNDGAAGERDNAMADVENVIGGKGKDTIRAGAPVANSLKGGKASDTLDVRDGAANDRIDGGSGEDRCLGDPGDTKVDCER
jgi:WD40 repeat protein